MKMDRVFLDANVLFSAAYRSNSRLIHLWNYEDIALFSSRYALTEAEVNLENAEQRERLAELAKTVNLVEAPQGKLPSKVVLPQKDAPILLAAIEAHATHLLTGDVRHFSAYFEKKIEGVLIMLPGEHLRRHWK